MMGGRVFVLLMGGGGLWCGGEWVVFTEGGGLFSQSVESHCFRWGDLFW